MKHAKLQDKWTKEVHKLNEKYLEENEAAERAAIIENESQSEADNSAWEPDQEDQRTVKFNLPNKKGLASKDGAKTWVHGPFAMPRLNGIPPQVGLGLAHLVEINLPAVESETEADTSSPEVDV